MKKLIRFIMCWLNLSHVESSFTFGDVYCSLCERYIDTIYDIKLNKKVRRDHLKLWAEN